MPLRKWIVGAFFGLGLLPGTLWAEDYSIAPGDVLSLRVIEWDPIENGAVEWEALRSDLLVDAQGMISVPFLGLINANGFSAADLSAVISDGLKERLAVASSLDAQVQVATYRPIFITGSVRSPGEYPFRPGATAAQLVAQAGGGSLLQGGIIDPRDILTREGDMQVLRLEAERLAIRRAMLQAAIEGLDELVVPERQDGTAWPTDLIQSENEVLRLRKERRGRELAALDNQIVLLGNEIEALIGRSQALERLVESSRREKENTQTLADRGLAVDARVTESEQALALAEAQLLDVSTAMLRARQAVTQAEAEKLALRDRELIEDTRELQQVEQELKRVLTTLDTQQNIAGVETGLVLGDATDDAETTMPEPIVTILRGQGENAVRLSGLETPLAPGDVVTVTLPRSATRWFSIQSGTASQ